MSRLDQLAQHREAILLAEIAAWLHDDFKHTDQQISKYVNDAPLLSGRQDTADLIPDIDVTFLGKTLQFGLVKNRKKDDFVDGYLNRCHYTAHIEKEDGDSRQPYPVYLSSPFGFELFTIPTNLTSILRNDVPWDLINFPSSNRLSFQQKLQNIFNKVGGDTRRPGNEITLWEWGHTVGALYKAALVGAYFQHKLGVAPTAANDLRWQLLAVQTNALAYLTRVSRLPDLLARQNTLQTAINNVQTLLEETYPLATEVYRDENGSLYVVPNLSDNLLALQGTDKKTLLAHIQQQFNTDGELVPQITLDPMAWWGQDPDRQGNDKIPPAGTILSSPTTLKSDAAAISAAWQSERQTICPICGLRPCVNNQLDYCQVCGQRREGRVIEWLKDQSKTIWLDEVADGNGRLALVTGTFDLTNWLDGSLVETLLVQTLTAGNSAVTKSPSFARLRRIWQTTQTFWQQTKTDINKALTDTRRRLKIQLDNLPELALHQTYELDLHGRTRMSVLWNGSHLISVANLSYTAIQLGINLEERQTPADAALAVGLWLDKNKKNEKRQPSVFKLLSDDEKNRSFNIQIADIDYQDAAYAPVIPILAEPRSFMALVPAGKALDVVGAIRTKYEREMGKVRNRLPLHLGLVYFHRRTPLRAALDAGRRMLKYELGMMQDKVWRVIEDARKGSLPNDKTHPAESGNGQFTETITVKLEQNGRSLTWHVPAKMGDGTTDDNWYPYVFIQNDVNDRSCTFKALRPKSNGTSEECRLVHAGELKKDDHIYFTPATLDFQWLDSAATRFEVAYDKNGRRRNHLPRPYLLDQLDELKAAWKIIAGDNGLTSSQIYALCDLIEAKRESWQPSAEDWNKDCRPDTGMFRQFCRDAVVNANWKNKPGEEDIERLAGWAVSGLLTDAIQLYMGMMKQKLQREKKRNE